MSCERALPLLYDLSDGDIAREDAVWLALHLATCRACADELLALQKADSFLADTMKVTAPPGLARRIVESVESSALAKRRDSLWAGLAAFVAAACLTMVIAGGRTAPGSLAGLLWDRGSVIFQAFVSLPSASPRALVERTAGLPEELAHFWPGPSPSAESPTVLGLMVALQLLGSFWFLTLRKTGRREASAP
jgi:anti-sigma factor RsiW